MSVLAQILGQDRPIGILATLLRGKNLPHAFLFTGIERIGKATTARAMAAACNCSNPPDAGEGLPFCGHCRSCRRIIDGVHPDVFTIVPTGASIKIAQVRGLCANLAMRPYEAAMRVGIIVGAQAMTTAAANALLKILEEPPAGTILILTAPRRSDLLPTIASRCRQIQFYPIPAPTLQTALIQSKGLEPQQAQVVAHMAGGSYGRAMEMADGDWLAYRRWLLETVDALPQLDLAARLALAETMARQKDSLQAGLALVQAYLRDVIVQKFAPDKLINRDMTARIGAAADRNRTDSLLERFWAVEQAWQDVAANGNARLSLEAMIAKWNHRV